MSILVVDDQFINILTLSRLLQTLNYDVLQAKDGQEGLELFLRHRQSIALVFLDLAMPVLDGWATVTKMRSFEEEHGMVQVPIVAYTSEDVSLGSPGWARCIEIGFSAMVVKPLDRPRTQRLLSRYVIGEAPPAPPPSICTSCRSSMEVFSSQAALPGRSLQGSRSSGSFVQYLGTSSGWDAVRNSSFYASALPGPLSQPAER